MIASIPQIKEAVIVKSQGIMRIIAKGEKDKLMIINSYFNYPF